MAIALSVFISGCLSTDTDYGQTPEPERITITVAEAASSFIYSATHGLSARSGLNQEAYEVLKREPSSAARYIANEIKFVELIEKKEAELIKQLERTIEVLGAYPSIEGDQVLSGWYLKLALRRHAAGSLPIDEYRLIFQILSSLADRLSTPVADQITSAWLIMDTFEKRSSLNYLAKAGRSRLDVIAKVRELKAQDPASSDLIDRALTYMEE